MKSNCWDFKKCGRESGGLNSAELGVCPAYKEKRLEGVHGGLNAGRSCWAVAGSLCGAKVEGTFAKKEKNCLSCDFHALVINEEDGNFLFTSQIREKMERRDRS